MIKLDFDERDLRSLRVFCSVAQAGGFSAAESMLFMSKASISRHIREVEQRLGVRLCERGPSGFELTPEGEVAVRLATDALRSLGRIRSEIDAIHGVLSGPLKIGIGQNSILHKDLALSKALALLHTHAPSIYPEIEVMTFDELNRALRQGTVDIAIRGRYSQDKEFEYQPLFIETHKIYVAKGVLGHKAAQLPLVYRAHPYVQQVLLSDQYRRGPTAEGLDAIAAFIATGLYQGILPTQYGDVLAQRFGLRVRTSAPAFKHPVCAVIVRSRHTTHGVRFFLRILQELHAHAMTQSAMKVSTSSDKTMV